MNLDAGRLHRPIGRHFRRKRFRRLVELFRVDESTTVLDLGGSEYYWQWFDPRPQVTILNYEARDIERAQSPWVRADGRRLPFADNAFDLVFCNSVIEHLPDVASRQALAAEIARVGRGYCVQTPNRHFPIEAHLLTPFIHFLPVPWQVRLARNFTLWGWLQRPSQEEARGFVEHLHLQTADEMRRLFPNAKIERERVAGLTKSISSIKAF